MTLRVFSPTRRIAGQITGNIQLGQAILSAMSEHHIPFVQVRGCGVVEEVSIALFDPTHNDHLEARSFPGTFDLLSLEGFVSQGTSAPEVKLYASVARDTGNGIEVLGGRLVTARARSVDVVLECLENPGESVSVSPPTAAPRVQTPPVQTAKQPPAKAYTPPTIASSIASSSATSSSLGKPASAPRTLADVAKALENMKDNDDFEDDGPSPGDLLEHPSFGVVEFEDESENGHVKIRLPSGSRREITLDVFNIEPLAPKNNKKFWALRHRRR